MEQNLFSRLESAGKLPTPPGVVLRLLELTRRSDVSVREIADAMVLDPALAAKILRFANSPIAGASREITSLVQAVNLMGIHGVKMMALSFSVLSGGGNVKCAGFNSDQFAVQSLACGVAARVLATTTKLGSSHEAFSAGLLSQIGRSALAMAMPDEYAKVLASARNIPRDLPTYETAAFGASYAAVGGQLLRTWGIPETLCRAIEIFRDAQGVGTSWLTQAIDVAELAAAILCPDGQGLPLDPATFHAEASRRFGLSAEQCLEVMRQIADEVAQLRTTLQIPKGRVRTAGEIEAEVRERITELSLAMHMESQSLMRQQEELMRRATTDALTGVGNRAAFDARMILELERSSRTGEPFALLMIDVDRFKSFNDTFGHQAGDRVLQAVAKLLDADVRKIDYVARYGGEEFTVIAPGTNEEGILLLAERLRRGVETLPVPWEGKELKITISIGVGLLTEITDPKDAAVAVIRAADEQLYAAKCAGRNRVGHKSPKVPTLPPAAVGAR